MMLKGDILGSGSLFCSVLVLASATPSLAQEVPAPGPSTPPTNANPEAGATAYPNKTLATVGDTDSQRIASYDDLKIKGWNVGMPSSADTVLGDAGGLRKELAESGIGYLLYVNSNGSYNLRHDPDRRSTQAFSGQKPTGTSSAVGYLTFDLSRHGIPDGQIVVGGINTSTSWNPAGPKKLGFTQITYYQTFFSKRLEVKLGLINNVLEFIGPYIAGTLTSNTFGVSGNLYNAGGLNSASFATPGINLKINITDNIYNKFGIQRSVNPDGALAEVKSNPASLKWDSPNAGALFIDELGYRRAASPGSPMTWIRGGAAYNDSSYPDLKTPGTSVAGISGARASGNSFYYLLADRQISQRNSPKEVRRGTYVGFSAEYAPPDLNTFSQYYEARVYDIGLVDSRPDDIVSLVVSKNIWSKYRVRNLDSAGSLTHKGSTSITASYSAHLAPGIYAGTGLSYIDHPTTISYSPRRGAALNILGNLIVFFG